MNGWRIALGFLLLGLSAVAIGVLLRSRLARRWIVSLCVGGVFLVVLGSAMAAAGPAASLPAAVRAMTNWVLRPQTVREQADGTLVMEPVGPIAGTVQTQPEELADPAPAPGKRADKPDPVAARSAPQPPAPKAHRTQPEQGPATLGAGRSDAAERTCAACGAPLA